MSISRLCRVLDCPRLVVVPEKERLLPWHSACTPSPSMLDRIAGSLERYMDLLSARQKLVAGNVANADTPGYKTKDLDFRTELQSLLQGAEPRPVEVPNLETRNDGNNVSLDREARLLADNALRFSLASNLLRAQIRIVHSGGAYS